MVVYLNAGDDLDGAIARVAAAGGKVLLGKTRISEDIGCNFRLDRIEEAEVTEETFTLQPGRALEDFLAKMRGSAP